MKRPIAVAVLMTVAGLGAGADLLACGDKFLVAGRGTRYQRPKNFRAASILIYANPTTGLESALRKLPVDSVLKREGHRATRVETSEQLSTTLARERFDVVLAASGDEASVEALLRGRSDAPVVLSVCVEKQEQTGAACALKAPPKEHRLLVAIDKAVERVDTARKTQTRS